MQTPDVLVLGGGGTLGEAWMSALLTGIEDGAQFDARACAGYVGTSAGSIVATSLVAGVAPGARLGPLSRTVANPVSDARPLTTLRQAFGAAAGMASSAAAP
jgi:hypothetical protein